MSLDGLEECEVRGVSGGRVVKQQSDVVRSDQTGAMCFGAVLVRARALSLCVGRVLRLSANQAVNCTGSSLERREP